VFTIECGQCKKEHKKSVAEKVPHLSIPMLFVERYIGDTLDEAYKEFIAHVAQKHPEMMGDAYRWESTYIIYEATPNERK
jgi:hypothetical protein